MAHINMVMLSPFMYGTERVIMTIGDGLSKRGHNIDIVIPALVKDTRVTTLPEFAKLYVLSGKRKWHPIAIKFRKFRLPVYRSKEIEMALSMMPRIIEKKPDIVFTNSMDGPAEFACHYLARTVNNFPPIVSILHGIVPSKNAAKSRKLKMANSFEAVAVSEGVLQSYKSAGIIGPGQGRVIYNPACTPDIGELAKIEPDHPWFSDGGPPVILGAGRLVPEKDFSTLIDAFRRIRESRPCRLVILGEGPLRPELEGRIAGLGLDDCVSLPGWVENPFAFMARAALFVLSSRHEGFGNVLVEALACGCPAVSTDCPAGPSEILEDPTLFAPVEDPEALAQVMLRALDRPADKAALRASAARFSVERAIDDYEALIADVLARRGPPAMPEKGSRCPTSGRAA